jgi:hypothetical protein
MVEPTVELGLGLAGGDGDLASIVAAAVGVRERDAKLRPSRRPGAESEALTRAGSDFS